MITSDGRSAIENEMEQFRTAGPDLKKTGPKDDCRNHALDDCLDGSASASSHLSSFSRFLERLFGRISA